MFVIGGCDLFWVIFGIACLICYENPGMLKPFMTEVYTKLCKLNRTEVQGYIDLHVNIVSLPGFVLSFYLLVELFLLNLCFQYLTEFLNIRTCFQYCRLKQVKGI